MKTHAQMTAQTRVQKAHKRMSGFFVRWEKSAPRWELLAAGFAALIIARLLVENIIGQFTRTAPAFYLYEFSHTALFFSLTYGAVVVLFAKLFHRPLAGVATIFLMGFLVILTPPIVDIIVSAVFFGGKNFLSYYEFDSLVGLWQRFLTFYGADPTDGITYGVRVQVALALGFIAVYGYSVTQKFFFTLRNVFLFYILFFILGTMPSWLTIILRGPMDGFMAITRSDIAALFLSPTRVFVDHLGTLQTALNAKMSFMYLLILGVGVILFFWMRHKKQFITFVIAMRPLQMVYHAGMLLFGLALGLFFSTDVILFNIFTLAAIGILLISVVSAWISAAAVNDLCDRDIDVVSNATRPLITRAFSQHFYKTVALLFFVLSLFSAGLVHPKLALLVLAYHALTWLYNVPPLRLKRVPFIATAIAAVASLLLTGIGFAVTTPGYAFDTFPWIIALFLFLAYTFILPIKDLKDIAGDQKAHVMTLPVLFGEKKTRLLIAGATFGAYIFSPVLFGTPQLMLWAILFGGFSFWVIVRSSLFGKKITPRQLPGVIFSIVALYAAFLMFLFV